MSACKAVVDAYFEGFRRGDHERILGCLTDVAWNLPGYKDLEGSEAFDRDIESGQFTGRPSLTVDRLIEEADTVVAVGNGEATQKDGAVHRFAFCDIFTLRDELVRRVESYLVPLR